MSVLTNFLIGGLTVSGITYYANVINNPLIAGIIAAVPIGMPSSVLVNDGCLVKYSQNLMAMTAALFIATVIYYYALKHGYNKYQSVIVGLLVWLFIAYGRYYLR